MAVVRPYYLGTPCNPVVALMIRLADNLNNNNSVDKHTTVFSRVTIFVLGAWNLLFSLFARNSRTNSIRDVILIVSAPFADLRCQTRQKSFTGFNSNLSNLSDYRLTITMAGRHARELQAKSKKNK